MVLHFTWIHIYYPAFLWYNPGFNVKRSQPSILQLCLLRSCPIGVQNFVTRLEAPAG